MNRTEQKQTDREQTSSYQRGEGRREGQDRGRGLRGTNYYVQTLYKDILYSTGSIASILL